MSDAAAEGRIKATPGMTRLSVKKPFTVLVAVIIMIALGVVSVTRLSMDLLPEINVPYMLVITPYPGASPEKVEAQVTAPVEGALGTVSGVKKITSVNAENYSMVQLEFEDGTNMDGASLDVANAVSLLDLPESSGKPQMLELSMDMIATMYVAVSREGYDIYEMSEFVKNDAAPFMERQDGVANVSNIGLVEKTVEVELRQDKIDDLNDRILAEVNEQFAKALETLEEAEDAVAKGREELQKQEESFGSTLSSGLFGSIESGVLGMMPQMRQFIADLAVRTQELAETAAVLEEEAGNLSDAMEDAGEILEEITEEAGENPPQPATPVPTGEAPATETPAPEVTESPAPSETETPEPEETGTPEPGETETPAPEPVPDPGISGMISVMRPLIRPLAGGDAVTPDYSQYIRQLQEAAALLNALSQENASSLTELLEIAGRAQLAMAKIQAALDGLSEADEGGVLSDGIWNVQDAINSLSGAVEGIPGILSSAESGFGALTQAQLTAAIAFSQAASQLSAAETQLAQARAQYDSAKAQAEAGANLDSLLTKETLSGMIYAQNFAMPAGYIDDKDDNAWLLKVGDEYEDTASIEDALLADVDGVGTIRLSDVADFTVIDNADEAYTKLDGKDAVLMCIFKSSTAGTNEVSRRCRTALSELEERYPGTDTVVLVDQGVYITLIVTSLFSSMAVGALLAILILALFLRDVRPTFVVALSIPLSALTTVVLMYFSGLSLNMMTLSGVALGVGMLVDNSIVVMENIFRLRSRGIAAPRAAVQGTKQVFGAITSSTLTTICVFLPMIFTTGYVRMLLVPMALSITYCLLASLIVSVTVVPASGSTILRNIRPKKNRFFEKILDIYGKTLSFCLSAKVIPLFVAIGLLAVSVFAVLRTGIVMLPEMTSNNIEVDIYSPEDTERAESYAQADEVMEKILSVDGVDHVGIMDMGSTAGFLSSGLSGLSGSGSYGSYMSYVVSPEDLSSREIAAIVDEIREKTEGMPCRVYVSSSAMGDLTSFVASGMEIRVYGIELDKIEEITEEVMDVLREDGGFKNISNGTEDGDRVLHLVIDKDKAMSFGLTVAGVYAELASRITTDVRSTSVTVDGLEMDVVIVDRTDPLTKENLMDMEFEAQSPAGAGMGAGSFGGSSMAGMAGASGGDLSSMMDAFSGADMGDMAALFGADADAAGTEDGSAEENGDGETDGAGKEEAEAEAVTSHKLSEFATVEETTGLSSISRENLTRYMSVTAGMEDGYNVALEERNIRSRIEEIDASLPHGYSVEIQGESRQIREMLTQMAGMIALGLLFVYLVMVAQFQSLLSPFIILFTIPLAFTGGMFGLLLSGQKLSMLSLMGFLILMGTVVNNGIVFVDYTNQLRIGGMSRHEALVATGKTRMRPILMTAMTTIFAMGQLIFGSGMGSQLGKGMGVVIAGGLIYATLMTLYIVPVMYDLLFKKPPLSIDTGDDLDDIPDDAAEYLEAQAAEKAAVERVKEET